METITVNRFKPYRTMRWFRSNYLWSHLNPYLAQYGIEVHHGSTSSQDVLAIPCPHIPGREAKVNQDIRVWLSQTHRGELDYQATPMICDSSMDYAFMDPAVRALVSYPQLRAFMPNVWFRDDRVQQRQSWGGEYYGDVWKRRDLYEVGPDGREDREPLPHAVRSKIQTINRPPTPPFHDRVFEHIEQRIKPLHRREIDVLFAGRSVYEGRYAHNYPTMHRKLLERKWNDLPGKIKLLKTYDDFAGTVKNGKPVKSYAYPYEYVDMLLETKVVLSPWGWATWCVRDLEALACGCLVIKPECSNTLIYPDIYNPKNQVLIWGDIMYEHLPDQLNYCYSHLDEMQVRVDRGRQLVTDALYPNDKLYAGWTHDLRQLLEKILEQPAYAISTGIPNVLL